MLFTTCALLVSACGSIDQRKVITDADADGVVDAEDQCPLTRAQSPVAADGCAIFKGKITSVDFEPGDHRLNSVSRDSLSLLVDKLNQYPEVVIQLGGHTDNRGSARDNLALSKLRVMSVVKYLVANGVNGDRLQPFGFGESRPIFSNATAEGRAQNRRIEMNVVETGVDKNQNRQNKTGQIKTG